MHSSPDWRLVVTLTLILCGVQGCNDDPLRIEDEFNSPPSGQVELLDRSVWPGGTVRLRSQDFVAYAEDAVLDLGSTSVPMTRLDATTLSATLPQMYHAELQPTVRYADQVVDLPTIEEAGFISTVDRRGTAGMPGRYALPVVHNGRPHIAGHDGSRNFALYDVSADAPVSIPVAVRNLRARGPGMTYQPGVWAVINDDYPETWQVNSPVTQLSHRPAPYMGWFLNFVARLGPDTWFHSSQHSLYINRRSGAGDPWQEVARHQAEQVHAVYISPDAQRATVRVNGVRLGVPVFDAPSGEIAYRTNFYSLQGAEFSADGQDLALLGVRESWEPNLERGDSSVVELLRASDGQVLATQTLTGEADVLGIDPLGRWVFALEGVDRDGTRVHDLVVLDRSDLQPVARLPPPADYTCAPGCFFSVVVSDGDEVVVYQDGRTWRYALPSTGG